MNFVTRRTLGYAVGQCQSVTLAQFLHSKAFFPIPCKKRQHPVLSFFVKFIYFLVGLCYNEIK